MSLFIDAVKRFFPDVVLIDPDSGNPIGSKNAPIYVSSGAGRMTVAATIPSGSSVSNAVDLSNACLVGFIAPAAWTAAALNIEVSVDGAAWVTMGVFDSSGVATGNYPSLTGGAAYAVDVQSFLPFRYVRLRSGTAASAVNQTAQRDFTLILRALA